MPIGSTVIYDGKLWNNQTHGTQPVWGVKKSPTDDESVTKTHKTEGKTFGELLAEKINAVNEDQLSVSKVAEKIITSPEKLNVYEVTNTMVKVKQSLELE